MYIALYGNMLYYSVMARKTGIEAKLAAAAGVSRLTAQRWLAGLDVLLTNAEKLAVAARLLGVERRVAPQVQNTTAVL